MRTDIDWIVRDRKVIDGLDHLGIELVSINLYQAMLPGITNVTERARYYAFYAWTIHRYAHDGPKLRTKAAWRNWFRALDFTYALACMAYEQELPGDLGSSVVGADRARSLIRDQPLSADIDLRGSSAVKESGAVPASGFYFKNPEGGFGQYYKGSLRALGVVLNHGVETWPDVQLTTYAGKKIAEALDEQKAFEDLKQLAMQSHAQLSQLSCLGSKVHPGAIQADSQEAMLLRQLFFGDDLYLCKGQQPSQMHWRRSSLLLMMQFLRESGVIEGDLADKFRSSCMAGYLPDGRAWRIPDSLSDAVKAWGAYQRNDLLNYCLECLFYASLKELDHAPLSPTGLAKVLAERAMASVPGQEELPSLPSLPAKVSEWLAASVASDRSTMEAPWAPLGTQALADRLASAIRDGEMAVVPALAVRVLGRLAATGDADVEDLYSLQYKLVSTTLLNSMLKETRRALKPKWPWNTLECAMGSIHCQEPTGIAAGGGRLLEHS